jgi:ATP-binding cassette subfamily B protein
MGRLFGDSRRLLTISIAVAIGQAALLVPVPLLVGRVFDRQIPAHDDVGIIISGLLAAGLYLASAALGLLTRGIVVRTIKGASARLRHDLVVRMYDLPLSWHDRSSSGVIHSVVVQDSERVEKMVSALVTLVFPSVLVMTGLGVIGFALNPLLFVILLAGVPVPLLLARRLGRRFKAHVRSWYRAFDAFSDAIQLALRAMPLTKVEGAERWELGRRREEIDELAATGSALTWSGSAYTLVQGTVAATAGLLVLVAGGISVSNGSMSIGDLLAFYAVVALILRQVTTLVTAMPDVLSGGESLTRLEELLEDGEREPYEGTREVSFSGALELEGVSFSYGREPVLTGIDLEIGAGSRVTLVGPNGAGKSTLVNLMLGLYRPQTGRVLVDGIPLDELDVRSLRKQTGVVLQDPVIFPGTIRENIAYGTQDVTDEAVERAAESATAAAFIETLPDRYDTEVGDEGSRLSGGQRQRIAIARALLGEPALLLLDEPTTYLDDAAITLLMGNLAHLAKAPTVLIVTHDPGVAAGSERVVYVRDGKVFADEPGGLAPPDLTAGPAA